MSLYHLKFYTEVICCGYMATVLSFGCKLNNFVLFSIFWLDFIVEHL